MLARLGLCVGARLAALVDVEVIDADLCASEACRLARPVTELLECVRLSLPLVGGCKAASSFRDAAGGDASKGAASSGVLDKLRKRPSGFASASFEVLPDRILRKVSLARLWWSTRSVRVTTPLDKVRLKLGLFGDEAMGTGEVARMSCGDRCAGVCVVPVLEARMG